MGLVLTFHALVGDPSLVPMMQWPVAQAPWRLALAAFKVLGQGQEEGPYAREGSTLWPELLPGTESSHVGYRRQEG